MGLCASSFHERGAPMEKTTREVFLEALVLAVAVWPGRWSKITLAVVIAAAEEIPWRELPEWLDAIENRLRGLAVPGDD